MRLPTRAAIAALTLFAPLAIAQPVTAQSDRAEAEALFERLTGSWEGEGELMGRDARFTMSWTRTGDGRYGLEFTNAFVAADGSITPVLQATADYSVDAEGGITAHWSDSRPQEIEIVATVDEGALQSEWTAPSETGRTEYRVVDDDTVQVKDWVRVEGALRPFGEARYSRRPPSE